MGGLALLPVLKFNPNHDPHTGQFASTDSAGVPVADVTHFDQLERAMGQFQEGKAAHPERYDPNRAFGVHLRPGQVEARFGKDEQGRPILYDVAPLPDGMNIDQGGQAGYTYVGEMGGMRPLVRVPDSERPIPNLYRVMSEDEYQGAAKNGYIKSDGRMNLGDEGTVVSHDSTGAFYLTKGENRIVRIKNDPAEHWIVDSDEYIKTHDKIPFSRVDLVSPKIHWDGSQPTIEPAIRKAVLIPLAKFNPYHDQLGRFTSAGNAGRSDGSSTGMSDAQYVERAAHVEQAFDVIGGVDSPLTTENSLDKLAGVKGRYVPWRAALQRQMADDLITSYASVPSDRRAIILGGLGGAGKSTLLRTAAQDPTSIAGRLGIKYDVYDEHGNGVGEPANFVILNPDNIKEAMATRGLIPQLDDLSPLEASPLVHEEAGHVVDMVEGWAMANGKNIIWDITLHSSSSGFHRLEDVRAAGYKHVAGLFVDVSPGWSMHSAMQRHRHGQDRYNRGEGTGGRFVPPVLITNGFDPGGHYRSRNRAAFEGLKDQGLFDQTITVDNENYAKRIIDQTGTPA